MLSLSDIHDVLDALQHLRIWVFTGVTMKNVVFWGYKNPVRTSEETYYVSATEASRLMLC
jgi:hypothetical protein